MVENGEPIKTIAQLTGFAEEVIHANLAFWTRNHVLPADSRFNAQAKRALRPDEAALKDIEDTAPLLEKGDVDGFLGRMAPHVIRKMTEHALFSGDQRISSENCKNLAHMAGYKPVERIDVYAKIDRLSREELVEQIAGALHENKELARILLPQAVETIQEGEFVETEAHETRPDH